jgi:predicted negative regulator of RcsB-dependent stress response
MDLLIGCWLTLNLAADFGIIFRKWCNPVDFIRGEGLHLAAHDVCKKKQMSEKDISKELTGTPLGEISQAPPAFEMFLDRHQSKVIVLAILLIIGAAVYVVMKGVKEGAETEAGELVAAAEDIADYQAILTNHEGTAAAYSAKVLLADLQWEDGQEDDAVATLRKFLEEKSEHPAKAAAKVSLASKLRLQGKLDEASMIYKELTEDASAGYLAPYAWICLGDIAVGKDDIAAAEAAYGRVEKDYAKSPFLQTAMQRKQILTAVLPVEVAPVIAVPDGKIIEDEGTGSGGEGSLLDILKQDEGILFEPEKVEEEEENVETPKEDKVEPPNE